MCEYTRDAIEQWIEEQEKEPTPGALDELRQLLGLPKEEPFTRPDDYGDAAAFIKTSLGNIPLYDDADKSGNCTATLAHKCWACDVDGACLIGSIQGLDGVMTITTPPEWESESGRA